MASQLKRGAVITYISIGLNILFGLTYTPWMIHTIGRDDYGIYTLVMSVITLFVMDFGLGNAVTRYVAKLKAENDPDGVSRVLGIVYKIYLILDALLLIAFTLVYIFIPEIYTGLTVGEIGQFKSVFIIAALFLVLSFPLIPVSGILMAHERFVWLKSCDLVYKILLVVVTGAALLMGYGLFALVTVHVVAGFISTLLKLWGVTHTGTRVKWRFWDTKLAKEILSYSVWITVIVIAMRCIITISPSILGIVSTAGAIAVFGIVTTIEGYTITIGGALNGMFIAKVSKMIAGGMEHQLTTLMIRVARYQVLLVGFIIITFAAIGRQFIDLWVGAQFADVYYCALLVILPGFIHIPQEVASSIIAVKNKVKQQAFVYIIMAVVNLIIAFPLAKYFGAIGICAAIFVTYVLRVVLLNRLYKRELGIEIGRFFRESYFKMAWQLIVITLLAFGVGLLPGAGWIGLIAKGCLIGLIFAGVSWFFILNAEEKETIGRPLTKVFGSMLCLERRSH